MGRVHIITGVSSGFGRALAETLLGRGDSVVATARNTDDIADLAAAYPDRCMIARLDVTNDSDRRAVVEATLDRFGRIDVLFNNAGIGSLGAAEEFSEEQIRRQFEVNVFGPIELTRAVLPTMRQQKSGSIVNISSAGGTVGVGGMSIYCSSKFALSGFSEALGKELKALGIHVLLVEPGEFRTQFGGGALLKPAATIPDYDMLNPLRDFMAAQNGMQPGDPEKGAEAILHALDAASPPARLLLGSDAWVFWSTKQAETAAEAEAWRAVTESTEFDSGEAGTGWRFAKSAT